MYVVERIRATSRLAVYRQSVRLGCNPLETHNQYSFFFNWTLVVIVLCLSYTISAGPRQRSHSQIRVPRNSRPYFTVSDSRFPRTWKTRSPYLYLPGTGWPNYTPRHWVPFSSPTTRWATVEVFDPASTQGCNCHFSHAVRLSPLGITSTVRPIVPAPDHRWWLWSSRWNAIWQGKPKYSEKTCPSRSKVVKGGYTEAQTARWSPKPTFILFIVKQVG
jgi:hypothetical protein